MSPLHPSPCAHTRAFGPRVFENAEHIVESSTAFENRTKSNLIRSYARDSPRISVIIAIRRLSSNGEKFSVSVGLACAWDAFSRKFLWHAAFVARMPIFYCSKIIFVLVVAFLCGEISQPGADWRQHKALKISTACGRISITILICDEDHE